MGYETNTETEFKWHMETQLGARRKEFRGITVTNKTTYTDGHPLWAIDRNKSTEYKCNVVKQNRRSLKKNKVNKFDVKGKHIRVVKVNAARITSKLDSFYKLLFDIKPSLWMMQETEQKSQTNKFKQKTL